MLATSIPTHPFRVLGAAARGKNVGSYACGGTMVGSPDGVSYQSVLQNNLLSFLVLDTIVRQNGPISLGR